MKQKLIFTEMKLLGLALLSILALSACKQDMDPVPKQVDNDEILANAGRIHNEMISYYYSHRIKPNASAEEKLSEILDLSCEFLDLRGYDPAYTMERKHQIEEKFSISYLKGMTVNGYSIDNANFIAQLKAANLNSPFFIEEINKVLELAHASDNRHLIKDYVNKTFLKIKFTDDQDKAAQILFADIFNGSYEFWEKHDKSSLKNTHLRSSSWVIINDGIGGVLGSIFGPIGSIVVATAFSVATNEEING